MSSQKTLNNTKYWVYNDDPKLPVIVMIHGLRGTHHGLDLIAKSEILKKYKIIVPDLPGFGESEPFVTKHSIDNYVDWLHQFMTDLNFTKTPVLLGHSFGSIITGYYAKKYPRTISKLILENPIGAPPSSFTTQLAIFYYWLGCVLPEPIGKSLLSSKIIVLLMSAELAKTKDKKLRQFIHTQHLEHFSTFANCKTVSDAFNASISHNVRDVAGDIQTSTLLIAGDLDEITPLNKQYELQKLFPSAELQVIKGVGHLTHYETPEKVADYIKEFVS